MCVCVWVCVLVRMCVCGASVRVRVHAWVACLGVHAWVFTCMLQKHTHMQRVYVWSRMYVCMYVCMHMFFFAHVPWTTLGPRVAYPCGGASLRPKLGAPQGRIWPDGFSKTNSLGDRTKLKIRFKFRLTTSAGANWRRRNL